MGSVPIEWLHYRAIIKREYNTGFSDLYKGLNQTIYNKGIPERLRQHKAQAMSVAYILNLAGAINTTDYTDPDDTLEEFIKMGRNHIRRQYYLQVAKTPPGEYMTLLPQLYDEDQLHHSVDFRFEDGMRLFSFSQLYTIFDESYRRVYFMESPDKDSILSELCFWLERLPTKKFSSQLGFIRMNPRIRKKRQHPYLTVDQLNTYY
jgi:DNA primase